MCNYSMQKQIKLISNTTNSLYKKLTNPIRPLPNFIIIGAQKAGTTSLYKYLIQHPFVKSPITKELHFFDTNFGRGLNWYRSQFPLLFNLPNTSNHHNFITGEASPAYIFHPYSAKRIAATIPNVKLILLLRNPVDRAYSQYNMQKARGRETLSFAEAIEKEEERLKGELEKILEHEYTTYYSYNYFAYSYLSRGIYINQIKDWVNLFPKEQLLILKSEDLFSNTNTVFEQVVNFLNLPQFELPDFKKYNAISYVELDGNIRKDLINYFHPHNEALYEYLGRDFGWD